MRAIHKKKEKENELTFFFLEQSGLIIDERHEKVLTGSPHFLLSFSKLLGYYWSFAPLCKF